MNARPILAAGLAAALFSALSPMGMAQTTRAAAPAQPAGPPVTHGPPITGMCIFSEGAIIEGSKVGQAVIARLKVLKQQVDAELQPEADSINTEARSIDTQRATMD